MKKLFRFLVLALFAINLCACDNRSDLEKAVDKAYDSAKNYAKDNYNVSRDIEKKADEGYNALKDIAKAAKKSGIFN